MKYTYVIRYVTNEKPLHSILADEIDYSGGDTAVVVAFYQVADNGRVLIAIVSMQAGMIVERNLVPKAT